MADLFTRLVAGPFSAVPLAPRVPAVHESGTAALPHESGPAAVHEPGPAAVHESGVAAVHESGTAALPHESGVTAVHEPGVAALPRVPSGHRHGPIGLSAMDEDFGARPQPMVPASAAVPLAEAFFDRAPAPSHSEPRSEPRQTLSPAIAPGDLGGLWSLGRPQSSKISSGPQISPAGLRPREPEPGPAAVRRAPQESEPRTTVRIEIGRIEIRAPRNPVPPAPVGLPAPPGIEAPQGPSLADYLRGNDGRPR